MKLKSEVLVLAVSAWTLSAMQAHAVELKTEDGLEVKLNAVATMGTQIRMEAPDPNAYSDWPSRQVPGIARGLLQGQTGGSDLNYRKNEAISTVLKGVVDLDIKKETIGLFARGSAWKDIVQGQGSVPYGNYPNGFTPNAPLSDKGFPSSAQFSNAELRDVYLYGTVDLADGKTLGARLGRQVLQWGGARLTTGGINSSINPADFASQYRPGALAFEGKLPLGMLNATLATQSNWSLDGFVAFESRPSILPGCGTYFDVVSYAPQGCNFAALAGISESAALLSGNYFHRNPDVTARKNGQMGLSLGFKSDLWATDFRLYALNTHSTTPTVRMTVNSVAPFTSLAKPGVQAGSYAALYPEDAKVLGISFDKNLEPTSSLFGELAYRPNQPLTLNAYDLLLGFLRVPNSMLALNKGILAIPLGGTFDAYDRFAVVTGALGASKVFPKSLGADRVTVVGEVGISHVKSLPNTSVLRYGRPLPYNGAAYTGGGACVDAVPGKTCTSDGYVSSDAWGLRMLASAFYPAAALGADLTASLSVAKDVKGYSYDGTFSEGRLTIRPGLRASWRQRYFVDVQYAYFGGGKYNLLIDRDYLSVVAGMRF